MSIFTHLRMTKKGYKLERFAVLKEERGKNYGNKIVKAILNDLKDYNGLIYMHAQEQVIPFYEKRKILFNIDGMQKIEKVSADIKKVLDVF